MRSRLEILLIGLIALWGIVLLGRSGIHSLRIVKEISLPPVAYWPHLTACQTITDLTDEQRYIVNYRSLGETCSQ